MSLQGTLETFSLPDVLVLLSSTKKTGELKVVGQRGEGRVWVDKGQIIHCQTNGRETAPVDTVFELLRLDTGTFAFDNDATAPKQSDGQLVDLVLSEAQGRLGEWRDIEKVVPHLDAVVDMAPEASGDEVTVSRAQWKLLVAVAGGRDIHTLMARLDQGEFDTCKAVKELVESGMATIDTSAPAKAAAKADAAPIKAEQKQTAAEALAAAAKDNADAAAGTKAADESKTAKAAASAEAGKDAGQDGGKDDESTDVVEQLARARRVRATTSGTSDAASGSLAPVNGNGKTKVDAKVGAIDTNGANGAGGKADDDAAQDAGDDDTEALVAQLAALGVDEDDPEAKEKIAARLAAEAAEADGEEPINRGLLLKFLSSVRS